MSQRSDRCADAQVLFNKSKNTANIDHHETNNAYAKINIINPEASATGEVIFDIAKELKWKITKDAAICLYTAILTDTGGFKFLKYNSQNYANSGGIVNIRNKSARHLSKML